MPHPVARSESASDEIIRLRQENAELRRELAQSGSGALSGMAVFRGTFDRAEHPAGLILPDGRILEANRAALALNRTDVKNMRGQRLWETSLWAHSVEESRRVHGEFLRAAAGETVCIPTTHRDTEGGVWPFELSLRPIRDGGGAVVAVVAVAFPPDGLSLPGAALQQRGEEMLRLLRHMTNAFVVWETRLDESGTVVDLRLGYCNDAYEKIAGVPLATMQGRGMRELWEKTEPSPYAACVDVAKMGHPRTFEMLHGVGDGIYACNAYRPSPTIDRVCIIFQDVGERQRNLRELERLANEQRTILDTVGAGICLLKGRRIQWANPAFSGMTGYSASELRGMEARCLYADAAEHERVGREGYELLRYGGGYATECRMRRKSGEEYWCQLAGRIVDSRQLDHSSIWVLQDITERRQAEQALRLSEARLDAAQGQTHIGSWEYGAEQSEHYWSKEMFRLFGFEPKPVPPTFAEFVERIHPEDRGAFHAMHRESMDSGCARSVVFRSNPELGPISVFEARVNAISDTRGRISKLVGTLQDVTARWQTEESLRSSQAQLEAAQTQARIGSWVYDPNTRSVRWSREMFHLHGLHPDGEPPTVETSLENIHAEDREGMIAACRRALECDEQVTYELRGSSSLGEERHFCVTCRAVRDATGKARHILGTLQDITARKRAEVERAQLQERLLQSMKMEAVGRLAGGVAHDFNNLLTVITGNLELIRYEAGVSEPSIDCLAEIAKAASSATELTRQLLAFSRRQIIEPQTIDLNASIGRLHKMLQRLIGEDIDLETMLDPALGSVRVDPGQFEQVIVNLAVNARDAMPDGGRLTISTDNVTLDAAASRVAAELRPGDYVRLAVSDTGQGMAEDVKRRLFEPFFTTKPVGRGTGLGLAMIFGIVKQASGAIIVHSAPGRGTRFEVYLPRVSAQPQEADETDNSDALPVGSESILLVEDEDSVRTMTATFLSRLGYSVIAARNGEEALLTAERHAAPIRLLLTDVVMPGMNGRELAERLVGLHPETTVLFTSGYTEDTIVRHGVMDSQFAFIAKPYSLQAIAAKVRQVLDGSAVGS